MRNFIFFAMVAIALLAYWPILYSLTAGCQKTLNGLARRV